MTDYNPCECPMAGYCNRYKKEMDPIKWKLCQTREDYRKLFDEIAGNADFGMWKTAKKGDLPAHIPKRVLIKYNQKEKSSSLTEEQQQQIVKEHRTVEQAINELEEQGVTQNVLNKPSAGLGDTIEKVLTRIGITEKLLQKVTKRTCGCNKRKEFLNRLIPYTKKEKNE